MKRFKARKKAENKGFIELYGIHAVNAALNNPKRIHKKLVVSKAQSAILSNNTKISVENIIKLNPKEINKIYGNENVHQGLILTTSTLNQPTLDEILKQSLNQKNGIIVMLDQVTDPNNIGSIMRSCSLFGCNSIILSKDNAPDITPSMAKAACGAIEVVNYVKVKNLSRAIQEFKKNNFWICGLDNNNKQTETFQIPKKCLLVLGAEGKGLRQLTIKHCDEIFSIPIEINNNFNIDSLNVSNACSIALYEHHKNLKK